MYTRDELIAAGYGGYAGWSDPEAGNDFAAGHGAGKWTGTTGGGGAGGSFNFDYEGEVNKAYGELGTYYDRILKEARGDVDLAVARMIEDYETGNRRRLEDVGFATENIERNTRSNALARGLYQQSAYGTGFGIPDQERVRRTQEVQRTADRSLLDSTTAKDRRQTDLKTELQRREFDLEQKRRQEAADLASQRESRAFSRFSAGLV